MLNRDSRTARNALHTLLRAPLFLGFAIAAFHALPSVSHAATFMDCGTLCTLHPRWNEALTLEIHSELWSDHSSSGCVDTFAPNGDVKCAVEAWLDIEPSFLAIDVVDGAPDWVQGDERNGVYFDDYSFIEDEETLAISVTETSCWCATGAADMIEADLLIDRVPVRHTPQGVPTDGVWVHGAARAAAEFCRPTQITDPNIFCMDSFGEAGGVAFRQVVAHEMGHLVGLEHTNGIPALMNSQYPNGGRLRRQSYISGDEVSALADDRTAISGDAASHGLYWYLDGNDYIDLTLSPWVFVDVDPSFGLPKALIPTGPTVLCPGFPVPVEYTVHNLSNRTVSKLAVEFYWSLDDNITYSDRFTGALNHLNMQPNEERHVRLNGSNTFTVPLVASWSNFSPGNYWLGAMVDDSNSVSETNELNNTPIIFKQRVQVLDPLSLECQ